MEETGPRSPRTRTLDSVGQPVTPPSVPKPVNSSHIIDLRKGSASEPLKRPVTTSSGAKKRRPKISATSARAEQGSNEPEGAIQASPQASNAAEPAGYGDAAFPARPRFWSAFWRFLFLLIILGLVISLGVYLYINYYRT